jgi:hypothetical protein
MARVQRNVRKVSEKFDFVWVAPLEVKVHMAFRPSNLINLDRSWNVTLQGDVS